MTTNILPCPFCGGNAEWCLGEHGDGTPWRYLACAECEAMGPAASRDDSDEQQIGAWNRRTPDNRIGELEREKLIADRDEARRQLWHTGLAIGQIAKWPRTYFNRFYVEEWAIRTADILKRWGTPDWRAVLSVTSHHTKRNKRLEKVETEMSGIAALRSPSAAPAGETIAARDVLAERSRQVSAEGWTPEHDDSHDERQLAHAAACYAAPEMLFPPSRVPHHWTDASRYMDAKSEPVGEVEVPAGWPWDGRWWKPAPDRRRNLVKAGALILAEIERLDRLSPSRQGGENG